MNASYSLAAPLRVLRRHRGAIFISLLVGSLLGGLLFLARPKSYKAEVDFFLKNPMYADRNYLYNTDARMIDYFASAEDVDRLRSLVWSDTVQNQIIQEFRLAQAAGSDTTKAADRKALKKTFSENVSIQRSADNVVELWYQDKDQERASAIAARTVTLLEQQLRDYYSDMRRSIHATLAAKLREEDSAVNRLTDSLATLRERYGIYDIVSPSRHNIMLSAIKPNGTPGFARGLEEVQNIESLKDELVTMRSRQMTLVTQYATGTRTDELPLTRVIRMEQPPLKPNGPGLLTTVLACGLAAAFLSCCYFLAKAYRTAWQTA